MAIRGFEVVKAYQNQDIQLPHRATHYAAGYDIQAAEDIVIPSMVKQLLAYFKGQVQGVLNEGANDIGLFQSTLVPTGLKVYMAEDEYLQIINRSSNPRKRYLALPNSIGIIDRDYYNNEDNEGHIYVQLINYGLKDFHIHKGDRIAQAIFSKYLITDDDLGGLHKRSGGFGSTDIDSEV